MKIALMKILIGIFSLFISVSSIGQALSDTIFFPDAPTEQSLINMRNYSGDLKREKITQKQGFEIRFTDSFLNGMNINEPVSSRYFFNTNGLILKEVHTQRELIVWSMEYDYKKIQKNHKTFDMTNGKIMTHMVIQYNKNKQVLFEGGYDKNGKLDKTTEYVYDLQNRPIKFVRYGYFKNGKKREEQNEWKYEKDKTIITGTGYNGHNNFTSKLVTVLEKGKLSKYYRYDKNNKIIKIYTEENLPYRKSGKPLLTKRITFYDINGNIIGEELN
jgi:hypothetical protein